MSTFCSTSFIVITGKATADQVRARPECTNSPRQSSSHITPFPLGYMRTGPHGTRVPGRSALQGRLVGRSRRRSDYDEASATRLELGHCGSLGPKGPGVPSARGVIGKDKPTRDLHRPPTEHLTRHAAGSLRSCPGPVLHNEMEATWQAIILTPP